MEIVWVGIDSNLYSFRLSQEEMPITPKNTIDELNDATWL